MGCGSIARVAAVGLVAACGRAVLVRGGLAVCTAVGLAAVSAAGQATLEPSGRDFAGMRLAAPVVGGRIHFAASQVSVWSEATEPGTRRLVLDGGVRVT